MDLTIIAENGWALMTQSRNGRTALCKPSVNGDTVSFTAVAWFKDYEDAFAIVAAMDVQNLTIDQVFGTGEEQHEPEPEVIEVEPEAITAGAPGDG